MQLSDVPLLSKGKYGGYDQYTGYAVQTQANSGTDTIVLKNVNDALGANTKRILSEASASATHLFSVGQTIKFDGGNAYKISAVEINSQNRIELTLASPLTETVNVDTSCYIASDPQYYDLEYEISALRMNVSVVEPPKGYITSHEH